MHELVHIISKDSVIWLQITFVSLLAVAAWLRPLERARQLRVSTFALIAIGAVVLSHWSRSWVSPRGYSILRDWLPVVLLLVPYWQIGQFFTRADPRMESRLAAFDRAFFRALGIQPSKVAIGQAMGAYLELAYVLVYPLIPLGLVALYSIGERQFITYYWIVVLTATYASFAITPFVPALPPRLLSGYEAFRVPASKVEALNHVILRRASIQAITFPSGHVASAMAAALVLLRLEPWVGLIFLAVALSIAVATVVGGYHYAADVLLASLVAVSFFVGTLRLVRLH